MENQDLSITASQVAGPSVICSLLDEQNSVTLIYDGDCPVCSGYSRALRIRRDVGNLRLINARDKADLVDALAERGIRLNEGFVCIVGSEIYHGLEAIHILSLLSSRATFFNKANYIIFRHKTLARFLYPIMRAGRNALLRLIGRRPITSGRTEFDRHRSMHIHIF